MDSKPQNSNSTPDNAPRSGRPVSDLIDAILTTSPELAALVPLKAGELFVSRQSKAGQSTDWRDPQSHEEPHRHVALDPLTRRYFDIRIPNVGAALLRQTEGPRAWNPFHSFDVREVVACRLRGSRLEVDYSVDGEITTLWHEFAVFPRGADWPVSLTFPDRG